jgi:hypothetical protein
MVSEKEFIKSLPVLIENVASGVSSRLDCEAEIAGKQYRVSAYSMGSTCAVRIDFKNQKSNPKPKSKQQKKGK